MRGSLFTTDFLDAGIAETAQWGGLGEEEVSALRQRLVPRIPPTASAESVFPTDPREMAAEEANLPNKVVASKYLMNLPNEELLATELERTRKVLEDRAGRQPRDGSRKLRNA